MSYQIKMYVGKTAKFENWFRVFAHIDLGRVGNFPNSFTNLIYDNFEKAKSNPSQRVFFYGEDGDKEIHQDKYDNFFTTVSIDSVLKVLQKGDVDSKRLIWAFCFLQSIIENNNDKEKFEVIFFGH